MVDATPLIDMKLTQGEPSSVPSLAVQRTLNRNLNKDLEKSARGEKIKTVKSAEVASTATHQELYAAI